LLFDLLPRFEDKVMSMDVNSSCDQMNRQTGPRDPSTWTLLSNRGAKFFILPVVIITGLVIWGVLSGPGGTTAKRWPAALPVSPAQNTARFDPPDRPARLTTGLDEAGPVEARPVHGLRISSQFWRRGGLGSNAQVTFTLKNANDYAVGNIEIACSFTRRDGSHLTDRTRMIHDTVNMKSRRTFARMHVGFVNVNADKAKCAPIAARRI
jgi:hypothetical protein